MRVEPNPPTILTPRLLCWVIVSLLVAMAVIFLAWGLVASFVICLVVALAWLRVAHKATLL